MREQTANGVRHPIKVRCNGSNVDFPRCLPDLCETMHKGNYMHLYPNLHAYAQLEPETLQLERKTKRWKSQLVRYYGEGLKLGAMDMFPENYSVSMERNNAHWSFGLADSQ